jgi:hypothetical protein
MIEAHLLEKAVRFAERDSEPQFPAVKDSETHVGYRVLRDTGDRHLACRGVDGQPLR